MLRDLYHYQDSNNPDHTANSLLVKFGLRKFQLHIVGALDFLRGKNNRSDIQKYDLYNWVQDLSGQELEIYQLGHFYMHQRSNNI